MGIDHRTGKECDHTAGTTDVDMGKVIHVTCNRCGDVLQEKDKPKN